MKRILFVRFLFLNVLLIYFSPKAQAQSISVLDTNFNTVVPLVSQDLTLTQLFHQGELVQMENGQSAQCKGKFDFMVYVAQTQSSGLLWLNHETVSADDSLGDGGGASVLPLEKNATNFQLNGVPRAIDFSGVGDTYNNCLGALTPWGTVLTSEESEPHSNAQIFSIGNGLRDTSDFGGYARYLNYGWMVEVEPINGDVLGKRWNLGRFSHEGALCLPDKKTVYLLDDAAPGLFFKFVADAPGDLTAGTLFAYSAETQSWIPLPMQRDSLNEIRNVALKKGATIFLRLEDIALAPDGSLFLTETGIDAVDLTNAVNSGGKTAAHLAPFLTGNHIYKDYHGRILNFNTNNNEIKVWLEGGKGAQTSNVLSNPDNLSIDLLRNRLIIHEDINGANHERVPAYAEGRIINEIYFIDLAPPAPTVDNLTRFFIAPLGSESTGGTWAPDFDVYFVNIQHPSSQNPPPFQKDLAVALTGWESPTDVVAPLADVFSIYPTLTDDLVSFKAQNLSGERYTVKITDMLGKTLNEQMLLTSESGFDTSINLSDYPKGVYLLQISDGVRRLTRKVVLR